MDFIGVIILFFLMMVMCLGPWAWCEWRQSVRQREIREYKFRQYFKY